MLCSTDSIHQGNLGPLGKIELSDACVYQIHHERRLSGVHYAVERRPRTRSGLTSYDAASTRRRHTIDSVNRLDSYASDQHRSRPGRRQHMTVLVTGGAGYIGSHTVLELLAHGYTIVVLDNLSNSNLESIRRVEYLAGRSVDFVQGDVTNEQDLEHAFSKYHIWAVIHFAALKAVGESTEVPLDYYHNNLTGTLNLLRTMDRHGVKNIVFSSSATVYGDAQVVPICESTRLGPVTNPYARTKLFGEDILRDLCRSDAQWNACLLRYFNPVGAHPSGMIGECPQGIPNNLLPYVIKVLQGRLPYVNIFGDDYDTVDGTGVRDYIHVCDLATGHVAALQKLEQNVGCVSYNLGTGNGSSVRQIICAMSKVSRSEIPCKVIERRPGDVAICTADATLANRELGWFPLRTMDDMCTDMWRWTKRNPDGYDGPLLDINDI